MRSPLLLALAAAVAAAAVAPVLAKLPAPSDEAKAKAAEAAAKTAWSDKVAAYQLCKAQDRVAAGYQAAAKKAGHPASAPVETPACADPGPFAYVPPAPASAAAASPTPAASAPKK